VIGWDAAGVPARAAEWLAEMVPDAAIAYRSSSLINQLVAASAGLGLAVLPCYLADPEPGVRQVLPPVPELTRELWLITHKALKGTARVRAFMDVVGSGLHRRLSAADAPGSDDARGGPRVEAHV
jgi:DNA-binding transcriptional LysR family regulator